MLFVWISEAFVSHSINHNLLPQTESAEPGCFDTLGSELEKLDRKRCQVGSQYKILDVCNITHIMCTIKYTF